MHSSLEPSEEKLFLSCAENTWSSHQTTEKMISIPLYSMQIDWSNNYTLTVSLVTAHVIQRPWLMHFWFSPYESVWTSDWIFKSISCTSSPVGPSKHSSAISLMWAGTELTFMSICMCSWNGNEYEWQSFRAPPHNICRDIWASAQLVGFLGLAVNSHILGRAENFNRKPSTVAISRDLTFDPKQIISSGLLHPPHDLQNAPLTLALQSLSCDFYRIRGLLFTVHIGDILKTFYRAPCASVSDCREQQLTECRVLL